MEVGTKSKLTEEEQGRLAQAAFGDGTVILSTRELTGGFFNTAYELALADGREAILKIAPSDTAEMLSYERNIMRAEVEALRLVKAAGIAPVPEVYAYDDSRTVTPYEYFFMEKVKGRPYNEVREEMTAGERAEIERELGRYNRRINEVRGERFGLFNQAPAKAKGTWRETFAGLIGDVLDDAVRLGASLPIDRIEVEQGIDTLLPALDEMTEPRLVHWDLWDGNIFVADGQITSLIDWERALWGDPLMEHYFRSFIDSEGFREGYDTSIFVTPGVQARKELYDLYFNLIAVIEYYSRKYDNSGYLDWATGQLLEGWQRVGKIRD
ncbi:aminoglycoside phosphotransferase family protein [Paenibacillus sp. 7124]|uniref:Aminoglycoside phosphotransferase family protein n=1 Tax=Paenibacillus apii TaxID=1850370 RepID=A0A6M1PLA5_9BACL|nr:aminoglycoside phosphotransferase family protein [Paenibacillus apii]NGM83228.1 aminoglycoside phosphotransferase family protein [Paenibacillus apii]NJJ38874.1 aminoglycoside phosphotransferase family protein [Paenibacillus apii]